MKNNKSMAPNIPAKVLWSLSAEDFNSWRREHDFPRIINFLKKNLTNFEDWMKLQDIQDDDLLKFGPAQFLRPKKRLIIYELKDQNGSHLTEIREKMHSVGDIVFHEKTDESRKEILPYFEWAKKDKQCKKDLPERHFYINSREGRKAYFKNYLELLDVGNINLPENYIVGNRNLEFLNLDNIVFNNCISNSVLRLWYCSALSLKVIGDLHFIDSYKTLFTNLNRKRVRSMNLVNGTYQRWNLTESDVDFKASNSTLQFWNVKGFDFNCVLDHSEIKDCTFEEGPIRNNRDYLNASKFHGIVKRLYSQMGKPSIAGKHYFKEKRFEQKSLLRPKFGYPFHIIQGKNRYQKIFLYVKAYIRYVSLAFQNILWGYGEKPSRLFLLAIGIIIISFLVNFLHSNSVTCGLFIESLYLSFVNFTSLGDNELTQKTLPLKLYSAFEAFFGFIVLGLLIAGFASKSKDYS